MSTIRRDAAQRNIHHYLVFLYLMVMAPEDQLLCGSEAKLKKKNIATGHLMENTYWSQIESSFTQSGDFEGFQIFQDIT